MVTQITVNKQASFSQPPILPGNSQYIRKIGLFVQVANGKAIDLSNMRVVFQTEAPDFDCPPVAIIRVYNLKADTVRQIQSEFQGVFLEAGYQNGAYGQIFKGMIMRVRVGRESNIDSFVELMCSELGGWWDWGTVNGTLKAGANQRKVLDFTLENSNQQMAKYAFPNQAANAFKVEKGVVDVNLGGTSPLPRGKVMFGLAREKLSDMANSSGGTWSVEDGKINVTSLTNYIPGQAIKINAATGMVGVPQSTISGIEVTTLLNPNIKVGRLIQLNNSDITITQGLPFKGSSSNFGEAVVAFPAAAGLPEFFASLGTDGFYRALVVSHNGDVRGNDWYTHITALAVKKTAPSSRAPVDIWGPQGVAT